VTPPEPDPFETLFDRGVTDGLPVVPVFLAYSNRPSASDAPPLKEKSAPKLARP